VFSRRKPDDEFAVALYACTAETARAPELFEACGIPDTLDEPEGETLAQAFFDAMFRHLDLTLREIGVQDLGVGRRIKIMAAGFHGRALAYREALAGAAPLGDVLRRNAYGGRSPDDSQVARLEVHVRRYAEKLAVTPRQDLLK
jgi:cytochrome b pre-mRNA-processing protein 3